MPSFVEEDLHQVAGALEEDILKNMDDTADTILLTEDEEENEEEDIAISMEIGWQADLAAAREWERQQNAQDEPNECDKYFIFVYDYLCDRYLEKYRRLHR